MVLDIRREAQLLILSRKKKKESAESKPKTRVLEYTEAGGAGEGTQAEADSIPETSKGFYANE